MQSTIISEEKKDKRRGHWTPERKAALSIKMRAIRTSNPWSTKRKLKK